MKLYQVNFSKVWNILSPFVSVSLRNQVANVGAFGRLPIFLYVPVKLLYFQLQLLYYCLFLVCQTHSSELLLFEFDLVFFLSPKLSRDGNKPMRKEDDNKKHAKSIRGSHEQRKELLHIELILPVEINKKCDSKHNKYSINNQIVYYRSLHFIFCCKLPSSLILLGDREEDPGEDGYQIVYDFPYCAQRVITLHGVIYVIREQYDNDEAQQPSQIYQNFNCRTYLWHRILINKVSDVEKGKDDLHCHDDIKHIQMYKLQSIVQVEIQWSEVVRMARYQLGNQNKIKGGYDGLLNLLQQIEEIMHHYTKSNNVQALSIYNQLYQAKLNKDDKIKSRKHLLGLLSSFTREEEEVRPQQIEDLCCYDRMKKLINKEQAQQENHRDLISAVVIEQKINQLEAKCNKSDEQLRIRPLSHKKDSFQYFSKKMNAIEDIKKQCLQKFINHKQEIQSKGLNELRKWVQKEVDKKINDVIEQKKMQFTRLKQEKAYLQKVLLTKNLQIEALKSKQTAMKEYIAEIQQKAQGKQQSKRMTAKSQSNQADSFEDRFQAAFGGMTIDEVKLKLEYSVDRCLQQFDRVQNKNQQLMKEKVQNYELKFSQLQKQIFKLQNRQNELIVNLRTAKLNRQISQVQLNQLQKSKLRLQQMQKLILSIYNEWYAQRSESEKNLMKCVGNLSQNYAYDEMLGYIIQYGKKYSTHQKINQYLFKVLRGIQKIKRVLYPDQCNQKLDALATLQKIQKWIKIKVTQSTRMHPKKKTRNQSNNQLYLRQDE